MLQEISVENLAIIDRSVLPLGPGLTVLTGETGAGKSLLVDAIELALGGRAASDFVRSGCASGSVSLVASVEPGTRFDLACKELGFLPEDGQVFLQREVSAEGRSTCRVQGRLAPVSALKQLGDALVDLHGQHEHQSALRVETHGELLDAWLGDAVASLKVEVAGHYTAMQADLKRLEVVTRSTGDAERRLDLLRFQIEEIQAADPQPGEMEQLEARLSRLQHAEKLQRMALDALELLTRGEGAADERVSISLKNVEAMVSTDPALADIARPLESASLDLREACLALATYAESIDLNPDAVEETAERIDLLRRLRRKYGTSEEEVLRYLAEAQAERDAIELDFGSEEEIRARISAQQQLLESAASLLTRARKAGAKELSRHVTDQLQQLAMPRATLEARVDSQSVGLDGADLVEFLFSANPGEPMRPLRKVASGGELSRVMLALKIVLAGKGGVGTLIFDEVDAGLGGRTAAIVANKLEELAAYYQVICISHLPQIASRAVSHFRIEKREKGGRAVTRLTLLSGDERVEEIARMLAGESVGDAALANARDLLAPSTGQR